MSRLAWTYLQGEFDSGDQEHVGDIEVPAKRLVGCALDAPTLGESVLYIERSNLDTPEIPDRQLVVAFELLESERLDVFGKGRVHRPLQPTAWVGRCTVGTLMTPPGEVEELLECELSMALNGGTLSITSPIMPASCAAASPDAEAIKSELSARSEYVRWSDVLRLGDDTTVWDPPSASGADTYPHYELLRRTEMPPLPGDSDARPNDLRCSGGGGFGCGDGRTGTGRHDAPEDLGEAAQAISIGCRSQIARSRGVTTTRPS